MFLLTFLKDKIESRLNKVRKNNLGLWKKYLNNISRMREVALMKICHCMGLPYSAGRAINLTGLLWNMIYFNLHLHPYYGIVMVASEGRAKFTGGKSTRIIPQNLKYMILKLFFSLIPAAQKLGCQNLNWLFLSCLRNAAKNYRDVSSRLLLPWDHFI